jgi:hypothetical protein
MFEVQELELAEPQTFFTLLAPHPTLLELTQPGFFSPQKFRRLAAI